MRNMFKSLRSLSTLREYDIESGNMKGLGKLGTVETRSRMTVVIGVVAFVLLTLFLLPSVMGSSSVSEVRTITQYTTQQLSIYAMTS